MECREVSETWERLRTFSVRTQIIENVFRLAVGSYPSPEQAKRELQVAFRDPKTREGAAYFFSGVADGEAVLEAVENLASDEER